MIFIDRTKEKQTIILTLTEHTDLVNPAYIVKLKSDGDRSEFTFQLPENQSLFTERFDLFQIETSVFDELNDGLYSYQILLNDAVIEMGKAHVKSAIEPSSTIIQPNSSTDKILMYGE